jgi:FdhE protein
VSIPKELLRRLAREHPHSAHILKAFVPLLEAREALAESLPPPELPAGPDALSFSQGKAWLAAGDHADVYLDEAFLSAAPAKILTAAIKGLPDLKMPLRGLRDFLKKDEGECAKLIMLYLTGSMNKVKAWGGKHGQDCRGVVFGATHLASAAARRVARAAASCALPPWRGGLCPICGSLPHASALRGREGKRWLQCSLCRHEWAFSRTVCPVCGQDSPKDLPLFFLEQNRWERAEACNQCGRYLLGVDTREFADDIPLELLLLCMMPLDMLMQEKGFVPAADEAQGRRGKNARKQKPDALQQERLR